MIPISRPAGTTTDAISYPTVRVQHPAAYGHGARGAWRSGRGVLWECSAGGPGEGSLQSRAVRDRDEVAAGVIEALSTVAHPGCRSPRRTFQRWPPRANTVRAPTSLLAITVTALPSGPVVLQMRRNSRDNGRGRHPRGLRPGVVIDGHLQPATLPCALPSPRYFYKSPAEPSMREKESMHDALNGLGNRDAFARECSKALARARLPAHGSACWLSTSQLQGLQRPPSARRRPPTYSRRAEDGCARRSA